MSFQLPKCKLCRLCDFIAITPAPSLEPFALSLSGKPATSLLSPGPTRFQEALLFAAPMEGTQSLSRRHIPCRQHNRASSWADRADQGGCLDPARNGGLGRVWPRRQPELGISGLRELRDSHNDLFPSYVLRATGQDCPHSSLGPLRLRASFWWVVWASCHRPQLTLSQQGLPPPTASSPRWVSARVASVLWDQLSWSLRLPWEDTPF